MIEHAINIVFIKLSSVLKPHSPQKTVDTSEMLSLQKGEERRKKKKQLAYKAAPIYVLAVPLKWQSGSVRWLLCREAHFKAGHFISDRQPQVEHEIKNKKEGEKEKEINTLDQASSFKPCAALCVGTFKSAPELCPNYTSTSCRRNLKID